MSNVDDKLKEMESCEVGDIISVDIPEGASGKVVVVGKEKEDGEIKLWVDAIDKTDPDYDENDYGVVYWSDFGGIVEKHSAGKVAVVAAS